MQGARFTTVLGLVGGGVAGAIPFSLLAMEGELAEYVALALAVGAGAAGWRAMGWWFVGVGLGTLGGWLFWIVVVAADWKLLLYMLLLARRIYVVAALGLLLARFLAIRRTRPSIRA